MTLRVAVLGCTGLVGREMLATLEQRAFPVGELVPLASAASAGRAVKFGGREFAVREATPDAFAGVDLVLASAGGSISKELLPAAALHGAISVDNTSAFRMDADVPLVVPEVNAHRVADHRARRIIANPNCSTIQLVVALAPLHRAAGITRVRVSTYQSVSGAGARALAELEAETRASLSGETIERQVFAHPIAFNVIPQIGSFTEDGTTVEEQKMRLETVKIMEADIAVDATCVRVPVHRGHSEAVWIETREALSPEAARALLREAPGVVVLDDPAAGAYPTPRETAFEDATYVGRIRRDLTVPHGLFLWIVSDNLRKGAALNAIQIAELLVREGHLGK